VATLDLRQHRAQFRGELLGPTDPGYDDARRIYNGMIDRRPAIVARCADADDVDAAIALARGLDLQLAVRGGGHSIAGHSICEGGLVVDLTLMRNVDVDPERRVARAGGGTRLMDLDPACYAHGLATPAGVIGTTGVAGLTLGGGIGHLTGPLGFTCDNLLAAEVVTADGARVRASDEDDAELLWGLRGAGTNFGVVTSFEFRLHSVDTLYGGMLSYPADRIAEALRALRDTTDAGPDGLSAQLDVGKGPDGAVGSVAVCYLGAHDEGARATQPLLDIQGRRGELGPISFLDVQALYGESPWGRRTYWKGQFVTRLPDDVIDELVTRWLDSPVNGLLVESIHGVGTRVPEDSCAFAARRARFNVTLMASWLDPAEDENIIGAARELASLLEPLALAGGGYLNYTGDAEAGVRLRDTFGDVKFERLRALKRRYDPDNVFRLNQNIPPA
jgi:FAD/FMN-containing dehydrogenase